MARNLANQTNVNPPSADFPSGRIRDDTGAGDGTPVDEALYGDIHQFFMKLARENGVVFNNLPESNFNTYQLYQALVNEIETRIGSDSSWISFALGGNWQEVVQSRYRLTKEDRLELRGQLRKNPGPATSGEIIFTLPAGFRPSVLKRIVVGPGSIAGGTNFIDIGTSGQVALSEMGVAFGQNLTNDTIFLDNVLVTLD